MWEGTTQECDNRKCQDHWGAFQRLAAIPVNSFLDLLVELPNKPTLNIGQNENVPFVLTLMYTKR